MTIASREKESSFQAFLAKDKIQIMRVMCIMGTILYATFGVLDAWALPSVFNEAILIRSITVLVLAISFTLTFTKYFLKFYEYIVPIPYLVGAFGLESMLYLAKPEEFATQNYFAGLMLVIMILYSWTHLKLRSLLITTAIILSSYIYVELNKHSLNNLSIPLVISNSLYLVSVAVIGFIIHLIREKYMHENHRLQQDLKKSLKQKTIEANDNAYLANHDELTGLPNRRYIMESLEKSLEIAKEESKLLVFMFLDLNGFKQINDIHGHAAGDTVLKIVSRRLESALRNADSLSRLGGDEFLIGLMMERKNLRQIEPLAKKFADIISEPMRIEGKQLNVGVSIGIATYPIHGESVEVLMDIADKKMYKIKHGHSKPENEDTCHKNSVIELPVDPNKKALA